MAASITDDIATARAEGDHALVLEGVRAMLRLAGEDPDREGLLDTPQRFAKAWRELTEAPGDPGTILSRTFGDITYPGNQMIAVGPVDFTSVCEHHLLPFTGVAWVAYIPADSVVGLSKLPRLVEHYARRPQVQERLTTQIADALEEHLQPQGVAVLVKSAHSCMALRGVRQTSAEMVTSALRGAFKDHPETRAEFFALARGGAR